MALGTRVQFEESGGTRSSGLFPVLAERLSEAIDRGANYLLSLQASEGYWLGELEADTTLESDYIFYLHVIGKARPDRIAKLANYVRRRQLEDGGWNIYFGGPSELNATIKAYVALRLAGEPADSEALLRARISRARIGRVGSVQFVYAALPGAGGRGGLGHGPGGAARIDAPSELVCDQYLRNVFVDARDRDSVDDSIRAQAALQRAGRHFRGNFIPGPFAQGARPGMGQAAFQLAEFLCGPGSRLEALRTRALEAPAAAGAAPGARVDAGAPGTHRGARRDLSGHDEFDFCASGAGPFAGRSAHGARDRRIFALRDRAGRHHPRAAVRFAGLGYGHRHGGAGRSGPAARIIRRWCGRRIGCWKIRLSVRATGW